MVGISSLLCLIFSIVATLFSLEYCTAQNLTMSDLSQFNNYTDPSGNVYSNFTSNGKVTPYGYHFKNSVATGQFVAYVIWLTLFTVFTLGICCVRKRDKGKPNEERASYQYLRWPVMGVSTVCMLL